MRQELPMEYPHPVPGSDVQLELVTEVHPDQCPLPFSPRHQMALLDRDNKPVPPVLFEVAYANVHSISRPGYSALIDTGVPVTTDIAEQSLPATLTMSESYRAHRAEKARQLTFADERKERAAEQQLETWANDLRKAAESIELTEEDLAYEVGRLFTARD